MAGYLILIGILLILAAVVYFMARGLMRKQERIDVMESVIHKQEIWKKKAEDLLKKMSKTREEKENEIDKINNADSDDILNFLNNYFMPNKTD